MNWQWLWKKVGLEVQSAGAVIEQSAPGTPPVPEKDFGRDAGGGGSEKSWPGNQLAGESPGSRLTDGGPHHPEAPPQLHQPCWLLRRTDQAVVAAGLVLAGLGMLLWASGQAGPEGPPVDIDHAPPLKAEFRVDLNQAPWPELAQLPGIGPGLARRIVEYRLKHGPFRSVDQLLEVRGIGPKKLQQIQPYLLPLPEDSPPQPPPSP